MINGKGNIDELDSEINKFTSEAKKDLDFISLSISQTISSLSPSQNISLMKAHSKSLINNPSLNSASVNSFVRIIQDYLSRLNTSYDASLHHLKFQTKSNSITTSDSEMEPLISNCFEIEKHCTLTQIREQRSKISVSCIQKEKIIVENDACEEKVKRMGEETK